MTHTFSENSLFKVGLPTVGTAAEEEEEEEEEREGNGEWYAENGLLPLPPPAPPSGPS